MKIQCPSCDQRLEIPEELAGQTIECPACNTSLTAPALAAPPPPLLTPPPPIAPTQNKRKTPQATTGRKTKSPFPKWAIAVFVGVALIAVAAILFIPSDQNDSSITQQESTTRAPNISIHEAAGTGNIEAVKQHLAAGTDVDTKNYLDNTPLYFAVVQNRWEIAKLLIARGADVNAKSSDTDKTPLHLAIIEDNMEIVELLIAKGADVNAKAGSTGSMTPLHIAVHYDHKEFVELLIAKGANVNAKWDGMAPLDLVNSAEIKDLLRKHGGKNGTIHGAARIGDIEAVNEFLANGVDVNAKNGNEVTPLHLAAHHGHKKTVELLIAKGANMNAKDNNGETPLVRAISGNHLEIADLLRKHSGKTSKELNGGEPVAEATKTAPPTSKATEISIQGTSNPEADQALNDAVWEDNIKSIKQALNDGAKVDTKDIVGETPLHKAALLGRKEIAELLIAKGADVNAKDDQGGTPLKFAAQRGHKEIVELLIAKGANVNAKDDIGWTPLHLAAAVGNKEIIEILIAKGADVNAKHDDGKTPLDVAIALKHTETADLLRKHGAKTAEELKAEGK